MTTMKVRALKMGLQRQVLSLSVYLPQNTQLLKHLIHVFNSMTFATSDYVTVSHIRIIYAHRLVWNVQTDFSTAALLLFAVLAQARKS